MKRCVLGLLDSATTTESMATAATNEVKKGHSTAATEAQKHRQGERMFADSQEEIAFGPSPAYSLSKAAVNAAVRTWAPRLLSATTTGESHAKIKSGNGGGAAGVRLVAVCPGDVLTRMTSEVCSGLHPAHHVLAYVCTSRIGCSYC